jgi:hypothetical protein
MIQRHVISFLSLTSRNLVWFLAFLVFFNGLTSWAADIPTDNKGEQAMIAGLRKAMDDSQDPFFKNVSLGAGISGCEAFSQQEGVDTGPASQIKVLLSWQWLDKMVGLKDGTVLVIPEHAIDARFDVLKKRLRIIRIDGVLHTTTPESLAETATEGIPGDTQLIVVLPLDVQGEDGQWSLYTPEMAQKLLETLPRDQKILFLNGPRTGKHLLKDGHIQEAEGVHRTTTDAVTRAVIDAAVAQWVIIDFVYGHPSLLKAAFKFALGKRVPMVLPGESTSMLSEALSLGLRPAICDNPAMTLTSQHYVQHLLSKGRATAYPLLPREPQQPATPSQYAVVMTALKRS